MFPLGTPVQPSALALEILLGWKHYRQRGLVQGTDGKLVQVEWRDRSLPKELGVEMVEKDQDAQRMRKKRDEALTKEQRSELAKRAARARWSKRPKDPEVRIPVEDPDGVVGS